MAGLEVVEDYPFDLDGDGQVAPGEVRDYILVAHRDAGILIFDAQDRDDLRLVGQVEVPGQPARVALDRTRRLLYVSAAGAGIHVLDFDAPPSLLFFDQDGDGRDDRVLETIPLAGNTNAAAFLVPELGLAYAGGLDRGLTPIAVGAPQIVAVAEAEAGAGEGAGPPSRFRPIAALAPLGVPTAPDGDGLPLPASFRVLAALPAAVGFVTGFELSSLGPGGLPIAGAGEPTALPGLPATSLAPGGGLTLRRLADDPWEEGYQLYLSEEVAAVADLRAAGAYERSDAESARCTRCDRAALGVGSEAREILSGFTVAVGVPPELRQYLGSVYSNARLDEAEPALASVPWDTSPAVDQEPALNPSTGAGDAVPGTLLHSGEFTQTATDLVVRGRGLDFAFTRTYRSRTVGAGPLGPGWDFAYNVHLRELPGGDVELYDGRGRRETFTAQGEGGYQAPAGWFVSLSRTSAGWVLIDPARAQARFDRFGRMVARADAVKDSPETGNEMRFDYDLEGRLAEIIDSLDRSIQLAYDEGGRLATVTDFTGREVAYDYDAEGRLAHVQSPYLLTGAAPASRLTTTYAYQAPPTGLAAALNARDNLAAVTDPKGQSWLGLAYADADGDGRADEIASQEWGAGTVYLDYDFTAHRTTVTDRRGNASLYDHDEAGHPLRMEDPTGAPTVLTYDAEGLLARRTEPLGRVTTFAYDTAGDRRSRGNALAVTVTADGRGANGSAASLTTQIAYDPRTNRPTRTVDPRGAVARIDLTPGGLPAITTRAEGAAEEATSQVTYNANGQPVEVTNPNGNVTRYDYFDSGESRGYLRQVTLDPGGLNLTTRYETDARGNVTAAVDPRGVRHERVINEVDWLVEERAATTPAPGAPLAPALGYVTTYLHDPNGNLTERRDPVDDGVTQASTFYTYGPLDELLTVAHQLVPGVELIQTQYEYDPNLNLTRTTDPEGEVTETTYDQRNLPLTVSRGNGLATESYAYDLEGALTTTIDGREHPWTTAYDGYGRVRETADPLGDLAHTTYDAGGNPAESQRLAAGGDLLAKSGTAYDLLGRVRTRTDWLWEGGDPAGGRALTSSYAYDPGGNLLGVTDPLGRQTQLAYDAAERAVVRIDPAGNQLDTTFDPAGNPVSIVTTEQGPGGQTTVVESYEYDALNRQVLRKDGLGNQTQTLFDARGNPIGMIDPEGNFTARTFDSLDRMLSETLPEGISVSRDYDRDSRLTSYRDALGNATTWTYDDLGRRTQTTYPDGTAEVFAYDATGDLIQSQDPNGTVVLQTFDPARRPISRTITPGPGVLGPTAESYQHDGLGRLTQLASGGFVTTFAFDSLSRLVQETADGRSVHYDRDDAGNATGLTYPSGLQIARSFDALDRPQTIGPPTDPVVSYGYRGPALVATKTLGNGLTGTMSFDPARRPLESDYRDADGGAVFQERLSWSPRSLKSAIARGDLGGSGLAVGYDGAGRLLAAAKLADPLADLPNNSTADPAALAGEPELSTFTYDAAQNLLSRTVVASAIEETVELPLDDSGRNRPASVGTTPLAWDANGNLIQKGDLHLAYDYRNRLSRVSDAQGAEVARYDYDGFNRRVRRIVGGATEETVWSGWQPLEAYTNGQLAERRTYGRGLDEIVRSEVDLDGDGSLEQRYTPLYDDIGNLALVTDENGKPVERYTYSPYGERTIFVDSTPPQVEQVRVVAGAIWLEISEAVASEALGAAVASGALRLTYLASSTNLELTVDQPVREGRQAGRRLVLTPATPPAASAALELTIAPAALVDSFLNSPTQAFTLPITWTGDDDVLFDDTPPRVDQVAVRGGIVEIELSEEPDLSAVAAAVTIPGQTPTWELSGDGYILRTDEPLPPGSYQLTIATDPLDLVGFGLPQTFTASFDVTTNDQVILAASDPRITPASATGNRFRFQGHAIDPETGLSYLRNRYYSAELARFTTPDPMGYSDAASLYQSFLNDPFNNIDPLGLDTFVVKYGPSLADADLYVTIQFVRSRDDSGMTGEKFASAAAAYLSAANTTWSALNPRIIVGRQGAATSVGSSWEIDTASPFASQIILLSQRGTSHYHLIFTENADAKRYAHEFGHLLGLRDYYSPVSRWNEKGGISIDAVPELEQFGQRAIESIMGGRATESKVPTSEDIADILDPRRTLYELPMRTAPVHHLDISKSDLSSPIALFEEMADQRGIDITAQLAMLREKRSVEGRRRVVEWIMGILFGPAPH